jgi:hypothetical protein
MALTFTQKLVINGVGNKRMSVYLVEGDGESTEVTANNLGMQRIDFGFSVNVTNENFRPLTDYSASPSTDVVAFEQAISNGKTQLVIAFGY